MTDEQIPPQIRYADVPVRHASTVLLVRDAHEGESGVEVFLQQRVSGMAFAGGMTVFPGGGVDDRDLEGDVDGDGIVAPPIVWHGPDAAWFAGRFGIEESLARALVCAAVRETFEECGVLLAGPRDREDAVVADTSRYHEHRRRLVDKEISFSDFLDAEGLAIRSDLLVPWDNWITPVGEPRRYDTRFFLALVPEGQEPDADTSEAWEASWERPERALARWRAGERRLMPPTWVQLRVLAAATSAEGVFDPERKFGTVTPELYVIDGQHRVRSPGMDDYYGELAAQGRESEGQPPGLPGLPGRGASDGRV